MVSALANSYGRSGNKPEAENLIAQLAAQANKQYVSPYYFAVALVGTGQAEAAIDWLDKPYNDRSNGLVFLKVEPALDTLRQNQRFLALEHKLNFPN